MTSNLNDVLRAINEPGDGGGDEGPAFIPYTQRENTAHTTLYIDRDLLLRVKTWGMKEGHRAALATCAERAFTEFLDRYDAERKEAAQK